MNVYDNPLYDEFTGFTFNGKHSSQFGLLRISNGDRYEDTLVLPHSDEATDVPGGLGQYYWGEQIKQRDFKIDVAYDNIGEADKRRIKQWLHPDNKLHELIFDEKPYVKYWVKCSKEVITKELCFDKGMKDAAHRVYKGEFEIQFVAYMPYGISVSKNFNEIKNLHHYSQWIESSGLDYLKGKNNIDKMDYGTSKMLVYNPGDIPTDWEMIFDVNGTGLEGKVVKHPTISSTKPTINGYVITSDTKYNPYKTYYVFHQEIGIREFHYNNGNPFYGDGTNLIYGTIEEVEGQPIKFITETGGVKDLYVIQNISNVYMVIFNSPISSAYGDSNTLCYIDINGKRTEVVVDSVTINNSTGEPRRILSFHLPNGGTVVEGSTVKITNVPSSNSEIIFGIESSAGDKQFTFSIENPIYTPEAELSEGQKLLFYGGSVKINTNKKTVSWRRTDNSEWIGINEVIKGELFKIPNLLNTASTFYFDIDESNPQQITSLEIDYNYLYI